MSFFDKPFDANTVEPSQPFEVIPAGKYKVQVVASEMRDTKAGDGQYLWIEHQILDGEYAGRKVWDRINLVNNNAETVAIAQRALSALCHAAGVLVIKSPEQLHFKPVIASVRTRAARDGYEASIQVRGYAPVTEQPRASGARARTATQVPAPTAATARSWKRAKPELELNDSLDDLMNV